MKKKARIIILVIVITIILGLFPNPIVFTAGPVNKSYKPIIPLPIYEVKEWHVNNIKPHADLNKPDEQFVKKITGVEVFVFGIEVYDGRSVEYY